MKERDKIIGKIKTGFILAVIILSLQILIFTMSFYYNFLNQIVDKYFIFSMILFSFATFGMYKRSRISSTYIFADFFILAIYNFYETQAIKSSLIPLAISLIFLDSMIATYKFHKISKVKE